jgi:hypothetical protein
MRSIILEIVILTYENPQCLDIMLNSIEHDDRVRVTVLDNSDKTSDIMNICKSRDNIRYVKNKYNIGTGTILRAFEIAESKYVWVVGCCNSFIRGGIKNICYILERDNPIALLHLENYLYRNPHNIDHRVYTSWENVLIDHSYSVACSINSIIWNVETVSKLLPVGYDSLTSMCPHTAMLLNGMQNGIIELSFYPIEVFNRHPRDRKWSMEQFIKWIPCAFPYTDIRSEISRKKLDKLLLQTDSWMPK